MARGRATGERAWGSGLVSLGLCGVLWRPGGTAGVADVGCLAPVPGLPGSG